MNESAESIAKGFVEAINRHDVDALAELMTEEHCFIDSLGNQVRGRERMRAGWAGYFRMVPDYSIAIDEAYSDGPIAMLVGTAHGTYSPDGQRKEENRWKTPVAIRASILMGGVAEGKVAEWRVYADNAPIRRLMARPR